MTSCTRCQGCGQIANSDDQEPWSYWANLPPGSDLAVRMGLVQPLPCPKCGGKGQIDDAWRKEVAEMQDAARVLIVRLERLEQMATARGAARHMAGALGQVAQLERSIRAFIESAGITITKLGGE